MNTSLKILVAYHKPSYLLKNDIFIPIHVGRAVASSASKDGYNNSSDLQWLLKNTIGDDIGDNISQKIVSIVNVQLFTGHGKTMISLEILII